MTQSLGISRSKPACDGVRQNRSSISGSTQSTMQTVASVARWTGVPQPVHIISSTTAAASAARFRLDLRDPGAALEKKRPV
jgi:hypothetical protein